MSTSTDPFEVTEKITAEYERYNAEVHGIQSAVAFMQGRGLEPESDKTLRTGVNTAHASVQALAYLLISKGVFTLEEYATANADAARQERELYEAKATAAMGGETGISFR
jgi:hypothetical protein